MSSTPAASRDVAAPSADSTKRPVPSADPTKRVEPSADPTKRVEPSADPTKRVEPSADPTKRVEPSADPTKRAEPSADPTKRVEPSADLTKRPVPSPEPTLRPSPSAAPSKIPNNGPSALPTIRPSRRPAASLIFNAARSPAPTQWPARPSVSPAAAFGAIGGTLNFYNANATALQNPGAIQQATANIACAVRVPLENILIKNITQTLPDGTVGVVPFVPVTLNSSGVRVCLIAPRNGARLLRGLQTSSSVKIDYTIIDPAPELLTMDSVDFVSAVEADPAIADLSFALSSTGVSADAPPELALASGGGAALSPPSAAEAQANVIPYVVAGLVSAFVVGAVAAAGIAFMFIKSGTKKATTQKPSQSSVVVFQETAPVTNPMAAATFEGAGRQRFEPIVVRGGVSRISA